MTVVAPQYGKKGKPVRDKSMRNPKQSDMKRPGDRNPFGTQKMLSGQKAPWQADNGMPGKGGGDGAHRGGSPRSKSGRYEFG